MCNHNEDSLKHIILTFYADLAHEGGDAGLEGELGMLAGAANSYSPDKESSLLDSIQTFLEKTAGIRKTFYSQKEDLENLLKKASKLNNKALLDKSMYFYDSHETIKKDLNDLEKCFIKTLKGQIEHEKIAQFAMDAGIKLRELLDKREGLKGGIES